MNPDLASKEELFAAGWKERQIDAALDEPDEVGPSGHWLNTSGKPYYDRDRVAVAAYRIGLRLEKPLDAQWTKWEKSDKPSSLPLLTIDFHRLADECMKGASHQFRSLRLSHPVMGRQGGTRDKEKLLIEEVLTKLVLHASGVRLVNHQALEHYLFERSALASQTLGEHWPGDVVIRPARRTSYVSKATGNKSIQRCIDAISLVHTGQVQGADGKKFALIDLLIFSPRLRFDLRWGYELNSNNKQHHFLFHGELSDAPGRNESWSDFVRYGGNNRWELLTEGTDFSGMAQLEPVRQVMGTAALVKFALCRDEELEEGASQSLEDAEDDEYKRSLGPTASRLREIASELNATFCVACLDGWLAGRWPTPMKEPTVRILEVKGVTVRGIWIRIYHAVYDVDTNLGPAYLYPPDANGCAKFALKSSSSLSAGRVVQVPKTLIPKIEALKPALELLRLKRSAA